MRIAHLTMAMVLALMATSAGCAGTPAGPASPAVRNAPRVGTITDISTTACALNDAEVEDAVWHQDVYAAWICEPAHGLRIGFARSADGGKTWSAPVVMPGSSDGWDPAVAVAPEGTLYVSFMAQAQGRSFPVVDVSGDQGRTFPRSVRLVPPGIRNWGDRDFIAAGPHGLVYVTWDYAPTTRYLKIVCAHGGSCSFTAGELNAVFQKSADYGRTWGPIVHVSPGYPVSGADSAPLLIGPGGRIDVLYQAFDVTSRTTLALGTGHEYFTASADGGATWSVPVRIGPDAGTISTRAWWIDGAIASDAAGTLYATWDTQQGRDTGWLAYSANGGRTWSAPVRVTPDEDAVPHIVQSAGGPGGTDYVGWLSDSSPGGYALYLRVFQAGRGWLGGPVQVSPQFGASAIWPGDTFGIAALPGARSLALAWGSAVAGNAQIYAAPAGF